MTSPIAPAKSKISLAEIQILNNSITDSNNEKVVRVASKPIDHELYINIKSYFQKKE